MALRIKINGQSYLGFQSATVVASMGAVTRGFSFVATSDKNNSFPIKIGDEVTITADEISLLSGYIETLEVTYSSDSKNIRVGGRSRLADFIDSTVPTQFEIEGTSLLAIASNLLSSLGLPSKVVNEAGDIRNFESDVTSAEIGQNALEFLESYSRKRQVLLTSDGSDTLILSRTGTNSAPISLKNIRGSQDNNILSSSLSIDYQKRYNKYVVKAQLNPVIPGFEPDPKDVAEQEGQTFDEDIRKTRLLELNSEESMDSFSATDRAIWEKNIRKGAALTYTATVVGNTVGEELWLPNTIIKVEDEYSQISASLLIKEVEYNFSLDSGSTTKLTMIRKEAYTLQEEQSQREANNEEIGDDFVA